ncbi:MAG: lipopolysaccharide biosynthesis protein [Micrococcales bacterium]|nr:lipopolysaccharide biosynthesis protein [Micrococcales bacterium]
MTEGLGRRAARGAASTGAGLVTRIALQLVTIVVLARLLTPEDYGIIAVVVAVTGVGELLRDFGLSSAAIQAPELSARQRSNLFWSNTGIGLVLGLVTLSAAVPIALLVHRPDQPETVAVLVPVVQALSVTFLLNAMTTQHRASLLRAMRFSVVAVIDVLAPAAALVVAVVLAATGATYWALVAQQVTQAAVALLAVVIAGRWLPSLVWHRGEPMRGFFRFGGNLLASQLIGYVANNIGTFLIGRRLGTEAAGLYNRAWQTVMTPLSQIRPPSTTVALPVLSRAGLTPQFDRIVRAGQLVLGYPVALGLAVVIGTAYPLVEVLLGPRWSGVPPIMRLLAIAGALQTMAYVGYWVYLSRGLTRQLMHYTLVTSIIKIGCVLVGSVWGATGVAAGYAVAAALEWPLSLWWLSRITPLPTRALYLGAGRILSVATATGLASGFAADAVAAPWPALGVGVAAGVAVATTATLVPAVRRDLRELTRALRTALSRRGAR